MKLYRKNPYHYDVNKCFRVLLLIGVCLGVFYVLLLNISFQANVIVNTTSTSLQLNYGAVSQSLLCVGGPGIQKECNLKYPNGIQAGDVAETSGGSLKCDVIYHGALLPWKDSGSLQVCSDI